MNGMAIITGLAGLMAIGVGIVAFLSNDYAWAVLLFVVGWITVGVVISHFGDRRKGR